jgi:membrane protease YdiL (CAAX protease family)
MSLGRLALRTGFDLLLAISIGLGLALTILYSVGQGWLEVRCGLRAIGIPVPVDEEARLWQHRMWERFTTFPTDDSALKSWLIEQPGLEEVRLIRKESNGLEVRFRGSPELRKQFRPPWQSLGYDGQTWGEWGYWWDELKESDQRLIELACLQVGFLIAALCRLWRTNREQKARGNSLPAPRRQDLLVVLGSGLAVAAVLAAMAIGNDLFLRELLRRQGVVAGIWSSIRLFPPWAQTLASVAIVLIAPAMQELFFRGSILRMWARSGRVWLGGALSAFLFAALCLDVPMFPLFAVAGMALARLYLRTRSLPASYCAHAVFNGAILLLVLGLIPGLRSSNDLIIGTWKPIGERRESNLEFTKEGIMKSQIIGKMDGVRIDRGDLYSFSRYTFLDHDHLELLNWDFGPRMKFLWHVQVTEEELEITEPTGETSRYRRVR